MLQQVGSRALLSANRTAELRHKESGLYAFAERPPGGVPPLSRQTHVGVLDLENVARDFDAYALPGQRFRQIGASGFPAGIEAHEGSEEPEGIERFHPGILACQPIAYPP